MDESDINELDFTIEFNSPLDNTVEMPLFTEADERLRALADDRDDMRGAAVNIRMPGKGEKGFLYEATVAVYMRPEQVAATEKHQEPRGALNGALSAVERQVREKRAKLKKRWEQPGNKPVTQEIVETVAAQEMELLDEFPVDTNEDRNE